MWTPILIAIFFFSDLGSPCGKLSAPPVPIGRSIEESSCDESMVNLEKKTFVVCESDGKLGLTWLEVEECEVIFHLNIFEMKCKLFNTITGRIQRSWCNASITG